jgi:hypothetical protein
MPLAHILAPQIARKVAQLEADLGRSPTPPTGYLQSEGMQAARAPAPPAHEQAAQRLRAQPKKSKAEAARNAELVKGAREKKIAEGMRLIPNANAPGQRLQLGMSENGTPIYDDAPAAAPAPKAKKGRKVIPAPTGAAGTNERGESVDIRGKNLGYLAQEGPVRTLERRQTDVSLGKADTYDRFGVETLQRRFGEHLKAMQNNREADGMPTDKFPLGYFDGMDARKKKEIEAGVARLKDVERGQSL